MNMPKNLGAFSSMKGQEPTMQKASGDLMMNLQSLMDYVGAENVETAIREMIASDSEIIKIQGLMLMQEFKDAIGENFQ